jgi:PAS domain S-box-containing protein
VDQAPGAEPLWRVAALALNAVAEGVAIVDSAHRIMWVNLAFETLTGYSQAEISQRTFAALQGPLTNAIALQALERAVQQQTPFAGDMLCYRKNGSTGWCELSISPVRDTQGNLTHCLAFLRDIGQRKSAEAQQHEEKVRFRDAAEAAGSFIMEMDAAFRFTYVSAHAEELLGYAAHEMVGHTPAEFMPPGEVDLVNAWFERNAQADQSVRGLEHRYVTRSGAVRWLQVSRIPLRDSRGAPTGHHRGTAFDITARKQAEAAHAELEMQMRESQKMEAIGTLAGGVAHDFNNIIAAILGNVNLARQDVGPESPARESLEEIHKAASRARDLVRQILSFSRRQQTQYLPIALAPLVQETTRMLRAMLPARVLLEVQCIGDTPSMSADASQIQQVLINLATNAMQAMDGQPGLIRIALDAHAPDEAFLKEHPATRAWLKQHPGGLVRLIVSDDGPGMNVLTQARIFEPFFTTKPVGEGTGLGLAVVHGIVQGHGGVIVVDSQPGAGTRFTLFFPANHTPADPATPEPTQPAGSGATPSHTPDASVSRAGVEKPGSHIVYVDDDVALVSLVKRLMERRGYRVSAHHDQRAALDLISADPQGVDLLLTDYNMPGMSGLELARQARALRTDLPIGIASGFIDETLSAQAANVGVHSLIFKATSVDEFCMAIEKLLPQELRHSRSW